MVCIKITERNYAANVVLIHVSIKQESDTFSVTNECISICQNTCFFFFLINSLILSLAISCAQGANVTQLNVAN